LLIIFYLIQVLNLGGDLMTKKKRKNTKHNGKTPESIKLQRNNLDLRWKERSKTGEGFSILRYKKDIIQFSEKEFYLPEKKQKLIRLENWERKVFKDCFYNNRPRLILVSLAKKNGKSTFSALV